MDIKDFNIVCINLDSREDRWEETKKELSSAHLLNYTYRFSAIEHENPIIGCALSHFTVLTDILESGKHAMIFEDDVKFINNFQDLPLYLNDLDSLDWDMLYLGANVVTKLYKKTDRFASLNHAQSTHAYCVNKNFIQIILNVSELLGKHMDLIYAENVIPFARCYITIPMLAIQRPSYSNIEHKFVDYGWMEERFNKGLYD
jgi:GR25 family glycosyltransferase involved in LPS biosynthesis